MNTFKTRAITALLFASVFIFGLLYSQVSFFVLMLVVLIGCLMEYFKICQALYRNDQKNVSIYKLAVMIISVIMYLITFGIVGYQWNFNLYFTFPVLIFTLFLIELFVDSKRPFRNIGLSLVSLAYVTMPVLLSVLVGYNFGVYLGIILAAVVLIIWANDTGAYIIGSLIGKHKLAPNISPNKSIEGFLGGGLMCFIVVGLMQNMIIEKSFAINLTLIKPSTWYVLALFIFIFATAGDLIESRLKRSLKIKDTGTILPGHGGFLDRFDAFLFVMPFVLAIIKILN